MKTPKILLCAVILVLILLFCFVPTFRDWVMHVAHRSEFPVSLAASVEQLSPEKPIYIDQKTKSVWLLATIQAHAFNTSESEPSQYHAIVWKNGLAKHNTLFLTYAPDIQVHEALVEVGAQPGNNLTLDSWDKRGKLHHPDPSLRAEGSQIEILARWKGSENTYTMSQILDDSGERGLEFRFGGNLDHVKKWRSGCVTCLYSCPGGKISNANYTIRDFVDGATRFHAREDVLPPDGTEVILGLTVK